MIKITTLVTPEQSGHHECATIADAHDLFGEDQRVVIARCGTDEECFGLISAVLLKSKNACDRGLLDTVMIWSPSLQMVDGDGWRLVFEQQEALTMQGAKKQQAMQQQQQAAAQAAMHRMMGGGGDMANGGAVKRR